MLFPVNGKRLHFNKALDRMRGQLSNDVSEDRSRGRAGGRKQPRSGRRVGSKAELGDKSERVESTQEKPGGGVRTDHRGACMKQKATWNLDQMVLTL